MTILSLEGSRRAAAALLLAALALPAAPAAAGAFRITPVAVAVMPDEGAGELRLHNQDSRPVAVRVTALRWTQSDGRDRTEPTADLVVSPPIFTVAPGAQQLVRIGFRRRTPAAAYRLIVEEIPGPRAPGTGVSVSLKLDLPLYVVARRGAAPALSWAARRGPGGVLVVEGRNSGDLHAQILAIEARDASGQALGRTQAMGVVLPSSSRAWTLGAKAGTPTALVVRTAAGETRVAVRVAP
ncbi:MAG: molecular chaperone [Alphaproteobacteria bacterium]|nr:molecular chaperone [Alphaproteobacteria bacterium]MBV9371498.1 molecular chaperone [Alphaproteobacteria bacterium]MBV9902760.1 molecular chaperone [Alphaproteobacteria bacterium]